MTDTDADRTRDRNRSQWGPWALAVSVGLLGVIALGREIYQQVRRRGRD